MVTSHYGNRSRFGFSPQITGDTQKGSLLAAGLAAVKISPPQTGQIVAPTRQRDDTLSDGESLMGDLRVDHGADHGSGGCTVSIVAHDV